MPITMNDLARQRRRQQQANPYEEMRANILANRQAQSIRASELAHRPMTEADRMAADVELIQRTGRAQPSFSAPNGGGYGSMDPSRTLAGQRMISSAYPAPAPPIPLAQRRAAAQKATGIKLGSDLTGIAATYLGYDQAGNRLPLEEMEKRLPQADQALQDSGMTPGDILSKTTEGRSILRKAGLDESRARAKQIAQTRRETTGRETLPRRPGESAAERKAKGQKNRDIRALVKRGMPAPRARVSVEALEKLEQGKELTPSQWMTLGGPEAGMMALEAQVKQDPAYQAHQERMAMLGQPGMDPQTFSILQSLQNIRQGKPAMSHDNGGPEDTFVSTQAADWQMEYAQADERRQHKMLQEANAPDELLQAKDPGPGVLGQNIFGTAAGIFPEGSPPNELLRPGSTGLPRASGVQMLFDLWDRMSDSEDGILPRARQTFGPGGPLELYR